MNLVFNVKNTLSEKVYSLEEAFNQKFVYFIGNELVAKSNYVIKIFTGFFDKNNTPIFEGDYVITDNKSKYKIVFHKGRFYRALFDKKGVVTYYPLFNSFDVNNIIDNITICEVEQYSH